MTSRVRRRDSTAADSEQKDRSDGTSIHILNICMISIYLSVPEERQGTARRFEKAKLEKSRARAYFSWPSLGRRFTAAVAVSCGRWHESERSRSDGVSLPRGEGGGRNKSLTRLLDFEVAVCGEVILVVVAVALHNHLQC